MGEPFKLVSNHWVGGAAAAPLPVERPIPAFLARLDTKISAAHQKEKEVKKWSCLCELKATR